MNVCVLSEFYQKSTNVSFAWTRDHEDPCNNSLALLRHLGFRAHENQPRATRHDNLNKTTLSPLEFYSTVFRCVFQDVISNNHNDYPSLRTCSNKQYHGATPR